MLRPCLPQSKLCQCPTLSGIVELYQHGEKAPKIDVPLKNASTSSKPVSSFGVSTDSDSGNCVVCKERHPLCARLKFRGMVHD